MLFAEDIARPPGFGVHVRQIPKNQPSVRFRFMRMDAWDRSALQMDRLQSPGLRFAVEAAFRGEKESM